MIGRALALVAAALVAAPAAGAEVVARLPPDVQLAAGPVISSGRVVWAEGGGSVDLRVATRGRTLATLPAPEAGGTHGLRGLALAGRTLAVGREVFPPPRACPGPDPCDGAGGPAPPVPAPPPPLDYTVLSGRIGQPLHVVGRCATAGPVATPREVAWVDHPCGAMTPRGCRILIARPGRKPRVAIRACAEELAVTSHWLAWSHQVDEGPLSRIHLLDRRTGRRAHFTVYRGAGLALGPDGRLAVGGSLCVRGVCRRLGDAIVLTLKAGRDPRDLRGSAAVNGFIGLRGGRVAAVTDALVAAGAGPCGSFVVPQTVLVGTRHSGLRPVRRFGPRCAQIGVTAWDGRRFAYEVTTRRGTLIALSPPR